MRILNISYFVLLTSLILLTGVSGADEVNGTIEGFVTDPAGNPLIGAIVMVSETRLGAMTDANGSYSIINVPSGEYEIHASMVGMRAVTESEVTVTAGSRVVLDFQLSATSLYPPPPEYKWPSFEPESEASLELVLSAEILPFHTELSLFVIKSGNIENARREIPELNGNSFVIGIPSDTCTIVWSLPFMAEQREIVCVPEGELRQLELRLSNNPSDSTVDPSAFIVTSGSECLALCDEEYDEWVAEGYEIHRTGIDPWDYGDHSLAWAGFISYSLFWDVNENGYNWRILLIYTDHLTILEEDTAPVNLPFEMEVLNPMMSLTGKYLLAFQADVPLMAGEALLVDIEDLISHRFDPIPVRIVSNQSSGTQRSVITVSSPECIYAVTDSGVVYAISDSITVRYFVDPDLEDEILCDILPIAPEFAIEGLHGNLICLDNHLQPSELYQIDNEGDWQQHHLDSTLWYGGKIFDTFSSRVLRFDTNPWSASGLSLNDIETGENIWHVWPSEPAIGCMLSRCGKYYSARMPIAFQKYYCVVSNTSDPERPMVQFRGFTDIWNVFNTVSVSSNGSSLWHLRSHQDSDYIPLLEDVERYVLINNIGDLLWVSPIRYRTIKAFNEPNYYYMGLPGNALNCFEGGRFIWNDRRMIYVYDIESDSLNQGMKDIQID